MKNLSIDYKINGINNEQKYDNKVKVTGWKKA